MPQNSLLFPDKFILDGTANQSGIGALEVAVNGLQIASKSGAMRQANALRQGGLNSIKNQNRGMPILNTLLSTRSVGKYTVPPSEATGTLGYFVSGAGDPITQPIASVQRIERFTFSTNTIASLGNFTGIVSSSFCIANVANGYILRTNQISRMSFQSELFAPIGGTLFPTRFQGASLKTASRGYACTGWGSGFGTTYGNVDRFSFAGEVCVSIGSLLQQRAASSGFASPFNGYIAGGLNNGVNNTQTTNIERFSFASETKADITTALNRGKSSTSSWIPGGVTATYIMGGLCYGNFPTAQSGPRQFYANTIEKFLFAGELLSLLGTTLWNGIASYGTIGNSSSVVMAGGISRSDAYEVQQGSFVHETTRIWSLNYTTETVTTLGATLTQGRYGLMGIDNSKI